MADPLAYLNGQFLPQSELHLAINDAGFVFGATVSDLCRTFGHQLFRLPDHLRRFRQSCRYAHISQPVPDGELTEIAEQLAAHNAGLLAPDQDLALVMFGTPGPVGYYAGQEGGAGDAVPTLCLHTYPIPFPRYAPLFDQGARLATPAVRHVPAGCI